MTKILAGDIGGTKTLLALYDTADTATPPHPLRMERFSSHEHSDILDVLEIFLQGEMVDAAAFGVAGPVRAGTCKVTNLPWLIEQPALQQALGGCPVVLLNDLEAAALGLDATAAKQRLEIQRGEPEEGAPCLLVGLGTGLGQALLVPTASGPRALPGEGGHADLGTRDAVESALADFLRRRFGHASIERVVSGPGLHTLYQFVVDQGLARSSDETRQALDIPDPTPVISRRGQNGDDPACAEALSMFLSLAGSECGNLALRTLPRGGLFLTGSVALALRKALRGEEFRAAFLDKDRMSETLATIPIAVVTEPYLGLLGARHAAIGQAAIRSRRPTSWQVTAQGGR